MKEKKLKIAQVVPIWIRTPPERYGGSEMICSLLTEALIELGHDVTLFATKNAVTKAKLKYVYKKPIGLGDPDITPTLTHFAYSFEDWREFDIIHSHGGIFGMVYAPVVACPVVVTMHNIYVPPDSLPSKYFSDKAYYISISKSQRSIVKDLNVVDVVYNSIDIRDYSLEEKKEDYLFWIGNLVHDKGPDTAIRVAKELGMKLVMAGKIDKKIPEHVRFYEEAIKPHIDGKHIIFHQEITPELKSELYRKAKCFLFPIRWQEPFGMVMCEAMASGTPVVAFREGSVPEVMKDKETGYIVDSYVDFISGVKKVLDGKIDPKVCRKHVEENFSPKVMAKNYIKAYEKILASKKGRKL